ncbi:MFS transporter [uncultured Roseobacter sp.]|uniref:MFS transporter n=1 Tax=uncultured Roseobacter sp. TaxID=114847 RepID=UPI002627291D|nr:MFS transporter [uncultured Roseobacter sp.]
MMFALMALNAAAAMPISFFSVGLPTLMRDAGVALELIGFTALVYLPFAFAFVWAPYIERPGPFGIARRRFWTAASLIPMGAFTLLGAWMAPSEQTIAVLILAFLISLGAATLRTTILGLTVERFEGTGRTWAAALVPAGGALGALMGATGLLLVYGATNWAVAMITMAVVLLLLLGPGLMLPETAEQHHVPGIIGALQSFLADVENRRALAFIAPLAAGVGLGFGMMQPRLVDLGYTVEEIGLINGLFTCIALFTGGPLAAVGIARFGLIRMIPVGLLVVTAALFYAAAASAFSLPRLHAAASVITFFLAFSFIGVMTNLIFMNRATPGREGTDFSIFLCSYWLCTMIGMIASGLLAGQFGYATVFAAGALVAASAGALVKRLDLGRVPA